MALILDTVQDRHLIHHGPLTMGNFGIVPYIYYNGINNYSYTQPAMYSGWNGFTLGCWINFPGPSGFIASVWNSPNNEVWRLDTGFGNVTFGVTADGHTDVEIASSVAYISNTWYFVAARYNPSTEIAVWTNDVKDTKVAGIPASLFVTSVPLFMIADDDAHGGTLECKISMFFFCDAVLADAYLASLYHMSKSMFNQ